MSWGRPAPSSSWTPPCARAVDEALTHVPPARSGGGQAANTANALARLGYRTTMIGRVGDDDEGRFVLEELAPAEGRLVARGGETGRVYVLLDEDGERRNLVWPAANDALSPADVPRRLPRTRFAYFSSFVGDGPLDAQLALFGASRPRPRSPSTPARSTRARASSVSSRCCSAAATCSPPRRS